MGSIPSITGGRERPADANSRLDAAPSTANPERLHVSIRAVRAHSSPCPNLPARNCSPPQKLAGRVLAPIIRFR